MAQLVEVTVVLKGNDSKYQQKFLCYDEVKMDMSDPLVMDLIEQAKKNFVGEVEEVKIKALMVE